MLSVCVKPLVAGAKGSGLMIGIDEDAEKGPRGGRLLSLDSGLVLLGRLSPMAMNQTLRMRLRGVRVGRKE